ncbi:hypothetical protein HW555_000373 [Spodoptera exigua]|uniref:Uncharacterized protein n=1 Tax=Spodoptera exigua TaxID=7107 RepID=A0A835LGF3_SPOEX|nr:hypothetical protein HW555_000373 [Spodoptera exigua]
MTGDTKADWMSIANHHNKNKGNVKAEGNPSAGDGEHPVNAGEVHWPEVEVSRIHNFPVPEAFKHGPSNHSHASENTVRQVVLEVSDTGAQSFNA